MKAEEHWQLMIWVSAQAGNRAGKTGRYLQWWDTRPECNAVTSTECKVHNSTFFSRHSRQKALLPRLGRTIGAGRMGERIRKAEQILTVNARKARKQHNRKFRIMKKLTAP